MAAQDSEIERLLSQGSEKDTSVNYQPVWEQIIHLEYDDYTNDAFLMLDAALKKMSDKGKPYTNEHSCIRLLAWYTAKHTDIERLSMVVFLLEHCNRSISKAIVDTIDIALIPYQTLIEAINSMCYLSIMFLYEDSKAFINFEWRDIDYKDTSIPHHIGELFGDGDLSSHKSKVPRGEDGSPLIQIPTGDFWLDVVLGLESCVMMGAQAIDSSELSSKDAFFAMAFTRGRRSLSDMQISYIARCGEIGLISWITDAYHHYTKWYSNSFSRIDAILAFAVAHNEKESIEAILHCWESIISVGSWSDCLYKSIEVKNEEMLIFAMHKLELHCGPNSGMLHAVIYCIRKGHTDMADVMLMNNSECDFSMTTHSYDHLYREASDDNVREWLVSRKGIIIHGLGG